MAKSLMHWLMPYNRKPVKVESTSSSTCSSPVLKSSSRTSSSNTANGGGITLHKITDIDDPADKNHFILTGYRKRLNFLDCMRSLFLLHNETINIWSHLVGFAFFAGLFVHDLVLVIPAVTDDGKTVITKTDFLVLFILLICYQATMILSSLYHTFECHASEKVAETCFSLDILGITVGLMATYLSGVYYAFYCEPNWRDFYLLTVGGIFVLATCIQWIPTKYFFETEERQAKFRIRLFVIWAVYGIVPTIHWVCLQDGGPIVGVMVPRIIVMYIICGAAFFFYLTKMPERLMPGLVDIFGHSHQWWHVLIFIALLFWHQTGLKFALFRLKHGCLADGNVNSDIIKEDDLNELAISFWPF